MMKLQFHEDVKRSRRNSVAWFRECVGSMADNETGPGEQLADTRARVTEDGRVDQKLRTRAALVDAAAELVSQGATPTLAEVAEHARISKTTAYRYFASAEALIEEVFFDRVFPTAEEVFTSSDEPLDRVLAVEAAVNSTMLSHHQAMRIIVRNAIDMALASDDPGVTHRTGRRRKLIEASLAPLAGTIDSETLQRLQHALFLVIGPEATLAALDVCRLEPDEARTVTRWAAEALVLRALEDSVAGSG